MATTVLLPTQQAGPAATAQVLPSWLSYSASATVTSVQTTVVTRIAYDPEGTVAPTLLVSTKTTTAKSTLFTVVYRPEFDDASQSQGATSSYQSAFHTSTIPGTAASSAAKSSASRARASSVTAQSQSQSQASSSSASSIAGAAGSGSTTSYPGSLQSQGSAAASLTGLSSSDSKASTASAGTSALPQSVGTSGSSSSLADSSALSQSLPSTVSLSSSSATPTATVRNPMPTLHSVAGPYVTSTGSPHPADRQDDASRGRVAGIVIAAVAILVLLALCLSLCARRNNRKKRLAAMTTAAQRPNIETKHLPPSFIFGPLLQKSKGQYSAVGTGSPYTSPTKKSFGELLSTPKRCENNFSGGDTDTFFVVNGRRLRRQPYDPFQRVEEVEKTDQAPSTIWSAGSPRSSKRKSLRDSARLADIAEIEERRGLMTFGDKDGEQYPDNETTASPILREVLKNSRDSPLLPSYFLTHGARSQSSGNTTVHKVPRVPVDRSDLERGQDIDAKTAHEGETSAEEGHFSKVEKRNTFGADLDKLAGPSQHTQHNPDNIGRRSGESSRNTLGAVTARESPEDTVSQDHYSGSEASYIGSQKAAKHSPAEGIDDASDRLQGHRGGSASQFGAIPIMLPTTPPLRSASPFPTLDVSSRDAQARNSEERFQSRDSLSISPRAVSILSSNENRSPSMLAVRRRHDFSRDGARSRPSESSNADSNSSSGATFGTYAPDDVAARLSGGPLPSALDNLSEGQESTVEYNNEVMIPPPAAPQHSTEPQNAARGLGYPTHWRRFQRISGPRDSPAS